MLTDPQFQQWETKLQLPVIGDSLLSAGVKDALAERGGAILFNAEQQENYPVHALMAAYKNQSKNAAELGCLYLLALFPYPVAKGVLLSTLSTLNMPVGKVLLKRLHPSGVFHQLLGHLLQDGQPNEKKLTAGLDKLAAAGLLVLEDDIVSVFRPVNAYFAESLRHQSFDEWRLQQQQLVYYYDDLAESTTDVEQRFWLHGKKLLHSLATTHKQQALDEIYRPHLSPHLAKQSIGSAGYHLRLHLLTGFFQRPWDKTDFCLHAETKGYVQAEAGQALYQLGEMQQALMLLDSARLTLAKVESWEAASEIAHLLGQNAADQHDMSESIRCFQQSIHYAAQGKNINVQLRRMRSLFQLHKKNGDLEAAGLVATKAKTLLKQKERQKSKLPSERVPAAAPSKRSSVAVPA